MSEMSETVRSSLCTRGGCIEVEEGTGMHITRSESYLVMKCSEGLEAIYPTTAEFTAFVRGVKAGEFDRFVDVPSANPAVDLADMSDLELPGMWEKADFMGGDPNERPNDPEDA